MYAFNAEGKRIVIQEVNDRFDLIYDGKFFQVLWENEKRKNTFDWSSRSKHDAF